MLSEPTLLKTILVLDRERSSGCGPDESQLLQYREVVAVYLLIVSDGWGETPQTPRAYLRPTCEGRRVFYVWAAKLQTTSYPSPIFHSLSVPLLNVLQI